MQRKSFDQQQRMLQDQVLVLGGHVEDAVNTSVHVLTARDSGAALDAIANHRNIKRKCRSIEADILTLLATQQPMAGDLRTLASALEVALELERIGSHAKEIAGIKLKLGPEELINSISDIFEMAQLAGTMLNGALRAYATKDVKLARAVPHHDDEVDSLYQRVHKNVLSKFTANQNSIGQAIYLSQVGHHLERVADRATNICEWIVFSVTGDMKELNV